MCKSISRRYYNNKSRIKTVGYYLGALQDVHVIEKLTNDGSVIIGIIVRAKTLEIVPVSLSIDRNGLV